MERIYFFRIEIAIIYSFQLNVLGFSFEKSRTFNWNEYIHRNPVRAGIATSSEDYLWSSHNAYVGRNRINWLTKDFGLSKFGYQANDAIIQYVQFTSMMETDRAF